MSKTSLAGPLVIAAGLLLVVPVLPCGAHRALAQSLPYMVVHEAGSAGGAGLNGGTGATARFHAPAGVACDGKGTIFVADAGSSTIRRVTNAGVVTLLAGRAGIPGSVDDTGQTAAFDAPLGIAVDAGGMVWVADTGNHTIRKVTGGGAVTTFAGGAGQPGFADATGTAARFRAPGAIVVDASGTLFVADTGNHVIRRITSAGVVSTLAGKAGEAGSSDGTGAGARFSSPAGLAIDRAGVLWVADRGNHLVRRVTSAGAVTTLAGRAGEPGTADGAAGVATLAWPTGIALDGGGNVYVTEPTSHVVRRISPQGDVITVAGRADQPGSADGTHAGAAFWSPSGIAFDGATLFYVADGRNHTLRTMTADGTVETLAGLAPQYGWGDGVGAFARFSSPMGLALDGAGHLYVADTDGHVIRKIEPTGEVTTLAGLGGTPGSADGSGAQARFNRPMGLVLAATGDLFVADSANHSIRRVTPSGVVTTLAGLAGTPGAADGTGTAARFRYPSGIARDASGVLYVADTWNHTIRRLTTGGVVTTRAGTAGQSGSDDGTGTAAKFAAPGAIVVNAAGDLIVADTGNATVRRVTTAAVVTTLAGKAGVTGRADGVGANARFRQPLALAIDTSGQVLVGDTGKLRRMSAGNEVVTIVGMGVPHGTDDGLGTLATVGVLGGLAVSPTGVIFMADTTNGCIRRATSTSATLPVVTKVTPTTGGMAGGTLITVTGANFTATDLGVRVGGVPLTDVTVVNSSTLVGRVPKGSQGARDVDVSSVMGRSTLAKAFEYTRHASYLAEGATIAGFGVELALLNPFDTPAPTTLEFLKSDGTVVPYALTVGAHTRSTVWPARLAGLSAAEFSTSIKSDLPLIVDRTMTWGTSGFGSHAESAVPSPALVWYLAEGATHSGFDLFYLVQNPGASDAAVQVTYLRPGGVPPLVRDYVVGANSRFTIWVDGIPELSATDVSAVVRSTNGVAVIVERAMYLSNQGRVFNAGHNSAGVTAPATRWFLAEGATGPYFDLFVLIANPGDTDAEVDARYLLADGTVLAKHYRVAAQSRFNIWVDLEEIPEGSGQFPLSDVAVSTTITSTNGVPVVVERAMWWPGDPARWHEAHNSPGSTETGTMWGLAAGEVSTDSRAVDTFILAANTSDFAGVARVTLYFEDGTSAVRLYPLPPSSRTNVWVKVDFPEAAGRRFGAVVESLVPDGGREAAQIVVERAMYSNASGVVWAAGTNARATKIR